MTAQRELLAFTAIALTMLVAIQPVYVAMAWNPFETLTQTEEQRKAEISKILEAYEQELKQKDIWTEPRVSRAELVTKIYEEEQMELEHFSEKTIQWRLFQAVLEQSLAETDVMLQTLP